MTNEQKNQVAAMNASGMSVDEIVIDTGLERAEVEAFVAERNRKNGKRGPNITAEIKRNVAKDYLAGIAPNDLADKYNIGIASVYRAISKVKLSDIKEKEPAAAATATDSEVKTLQVKGSTKTAESQVLKGVNVLGVLQAALETAYGNEADIMALKADSDTAELVFRYGGKAYSLQFGLAF